MDESEVLQRVEGPVMRLVINREKSRNTITPQVIDSLMRFLDQAEKDPQVRVLCITGAGDRAFCAGADLGGIGGGNIDQAREVFLDYAGLIKRIASYPKPTVARVNGSCVAGGTGFMLACDIVIAVDTAKFGTPEVNVGLFPMMIGALIFRNVLRKKAMEMVLLGEKLTAAQALEMGLVTRVTSAEILDEEVDRVCGALAEKSPIGLRIGKQAFYAMADMPFEQALDFLAGRLVDVASTQDAIEGISAFLQKRKPEFKGK